MTTTANFAVRWCESVGLPCPPDMECVEVMGEVLHDANGRTLWIEPVGMDALWPACDSLNYLEWRFHCVPVIDGLVHDAWHPALLLPPRRYAAAAFPGQRVKLEFLGDKP